MKQLVPLLAMALLLASCNQYNKTKSGMAYKIKKGGSSEKLQSGQFIKFNIEYRIGSKDSVIGNSSFGHIPAYSRYDTNSLGKYNFTEILPLLSPGDKLEFQLNIDTLKKMGMIPEYNKTFVKGGIIKGKFELIAAFSTEASVQADLQKEIEAEKAKEGKELESYMTKKGIKAEKTKGGAFVKVVNAGDLANKVDSGKQVSVLYKGYSLDGKQFDSNMDGGPNAQPLKLVIGTHSVIPGWEEGLTYFGKGGKGTILIPAMLAYGMQGSAPVIKPYQSLIFDIEVTDVSVPLPQPTNPTGQPMNGIK